MDINLVSFNGPQDNGRIIPVGVIGGDIATATYASALKCSTALTDARISAGVVYGGKDACVDVNNLCLNVVLDVERAVPHGQFFATIKGGSTNISLVCHEIAPGAKVCEVITDDWSDQSHNATKGISLDLKMSDGSAVRVISLKTKPHLVPGSGPYTFPWWQAINYRLPFTENYYVVGTVFDILRRWGLWREKAN